MRVEHGRSAPAEQVRTGQAGMPRIVNSNSRETKKTDGEDDGAFYALYFAFCVSR